MVDKNDVTRRERNENIKEYTPELIIPEAGNHLWNLYHSIRNSVYRIHDGSYHLIPPSEYLAWIQLTDNIVYPYEYDILVEMDIAFCEELNKELESNRNKREEQQQRDIDAARQQNRRGHLR